MPSASAAGATQSAATRTSRKRVMPGSTADER
jgi:hypothetical protein